MADEFLKDEPPSRVETHKEHSRVERVFEYPPQQPERPAASKGVRLEVMDSVESNRSLADVFRQRKGQLLVEKKEKPQRVEKTKEELAEIRR